MIASTPPHVAKAAFESADTVQRFSGFRDDEVKLVVYDWQGVRRAETTCYRADADDVALSLL